MRMCTRLTALQRLAAGALVLLLAVSSLAVPGNLDEGAERRAAEALLGQAVNTSTPVSQWLGRRFTLPVRERSTRVAMALATDLDADGDIDAIAATSTGNVLVWINVGHNRLERRLPIKAAPGQSRIGRPTVRTISSGALGVVDGRWFVEPARHQADAPPPLSAPRSRATDRMAATPLLSLPARAPPSPHTSPL